MSAPGAVTETPLSGVKGPLTSAALSAVRPSGLAPGAVKVSFTAPPSITTPVNRAGSAGPEGRRRRAHCQ